MLREAISKTRASGFIRVSKHLETRKELDRYIISFSVMKPLHSLLIYFRNNSKNCFNLLLSSRNAFKVNNVDAEHSTP